MTEAEAKSKWCPFARVASLRGDDIVVSGNRAAILTSANELDRFNDNPETARCIASACMAWRGSVTPQFKSRAETAFRREGAHLSPGPDDVTGYCGLAGEPQ